MTATVSEVPGVEGEPNERRPREFFGICNLISRNSFLGSRVSGFLGLLNMNIVRVPGSEIPGVQDGPYERRPLEFFGICNIISRIS